MTASHEPFGHAWQLPDVMALAAAANEAGGVPDPDGAPLPMNHTSDSTDESEEYDGW